MQWDKLLTSKRTGQESHTNPGITDRTQFQRDFDRLIFSSPFRRLQDKTQVFPLPGSVFVHNRLTHSLEVASVGRSLGNILSKFLVSEQLSDHELVYEIGSVVAAACLAHDMGNPPFGHNGEKAISDFFVKGEGAFLKDKVTTDQWNDLINFEGNANAFRLLTHKFSGRRTGGFALTYTTVASIVKYPYDSTPSGRKKYGFFQSENAIFRMIATELGIPEKESGVFVRHPLVYLVEAADDICYQLMDIEDAHKLGILGSDTTMRYLMGFFEPDRHSASRQKMGEVFREVTDVNEQVAYLRAIIISQMVSECSRIFQQHYHSILGGEFEGGLVDRIEGRMGNAMKACQQMSVKEIYKHPSVVEIEIAGYKILGSLLKEFCQTITHPEDHYSKLLVPFIPGQYRVSEDASMYEKIQSIIDFVSGMTDVYALELYRKINGLGLSSKGIR